MSPPLVSLCIPTRNRAPSLAACIEHVRQQDYQSLEILISDNASEDETPAVCEAAERRDPRIRVVRHPRNIGLYGNHNFCLDASRGEFVCFFHDHDEHAPSAVSESVAFLQRHPDVGVVCADWELIDEAGAVLGTRAFAVPPVTPGLVFIERTLRSGRCSVGTPGALARRAALGGIRFDEDGPIGFGDFPVWFRVAETCSIGHIRRRLWRWRQLPHSQSARTIESMVRDYEVNLTRYCQAHLSRWPGHEPLVARWTRLIRRYIFWALAYEIGLHHRPQRRDDQRVAAVQTIFEFWQYRLSPEAFHHVLDQLAAYRVGALEHLAYATMIAFIRLRLTEPLTWVASHAAAFRGLLRLR